LKKSLKNDRIIKRLIRTGAAEFEKAHRDRNQPGIPVYGDGHDTVKIKSNAGVTSTAE